MSKQLKLEFMGGLTKFQYKTDAMRQFQVKTMCDDEDSEITAMVRDIESWAKEHLVDELADFQILAPSTAIAWSNLPVPVSDYGMFFDVDFGQDIYTGAHGHQFKAKLTDIKFSKKKGVRNAVLTFLKNGEPEDDDFGRMFYNLKTIDEMSGKKKPMPVKIVLTECESFFIGNEAEQAEQQAAEAGGDDGISPVVITNR